jgi:hypothetical protein
MQWHDYFALALIAIAAMIVARRAHRALFGAAPSGCQSGCGGCPAKGTHLGSADRLLTIGAPPGDQP